MPEPADKVQETIEIIMEDDDAPDTNAHQDDQDAEADARLVAKAEEQDRQDAEEADDDDDDDDEEAKPAEKKETLSISRDRRQERKRRKEEAKSRDKARIAALEKDRDELAKRLASVENGQAGYRLNQIENTIRQKEEKIAKIKAHMNTVADRAEFAELVERLTDEKSELKELHGIHEQQKKLMRKGPDTNISYRKTEEDRLLREWVGKHSWFSPDGKDLDSKIALAVDSSLAEEGIFEAHTPDYYKELDARLKEKLPHRYESSQRRSRRSPPVVSSNNDITGPNNQLPKNQFRLSKERKEAMILAGVWDDPVARDRYIRQYQQFDRDQEFERRYYPR